MGDRLASIPEFRPLAVPKGSYDVAVLGGGLAGLTLALQIKRTRPETSVLVVDKRQERAPEAAFKVGESTVESGAHYYQRVLGLDDHLNADQFPKYGLRFFLPAGDNEDIARRIEFGTPRTDGVSTFQLDRGRFENELWDRCLHEGVDAVRGCRVREVKLDSERHEVSLSIDELDATVTARWVVDATGRANLLKRQLDLGATTDHAVNAAWFRLATGVDLEDWTANDEWLDRPTERGLRRHSTIHLVGEGYWVWLIQLGSGPISIGICADPRFHAFDAINDFDRLLEWFRRHEPQLATAVEEKREQVLDFLVVPDFSYSCERVYSPARWCLAGEGGAFLDPLYSPGSDFIGYGNTWITDLVTRDLAGEDVANRIEFFNFFYFRLFNTAIRFYEDQYQLLGNPEVMVSKLVFDNFVYFSTLPLLFRNGKFDQPEFIATVLGELDRFNPLIGRMAQLWRDWHGLAQRKGAGVSLLSQSFPAMLQAHADLAHPLDDETLRGKIARNVELIHALCVILFHRAVQSALPDHAIGEDVPINPHGASLAPERWEEDGLFSEPGITFAAAREMLPGVEEFFLEERGAALSGS